MRKGPAPLVNRDFQCHRELLSFGGRMRIGALQPDRHEPSKTNRNSRTIRYRTVRATGQWPRSYSWTILKYPRMKVCTRGCARCAIFSIMTVSTLRSTKPQTKTIPCFAKSDRTSSEIAGSAARPKYESSCRFRVSTAWSGTSHSRKSRNGSV